MDFHHGTMNINPTSSRLFAAGTEYNALHIVTGKRCESPGFSLSVIPFRPTNPLTWFHRQIFSSRICSCYGDMSRTNSNLDLYTFIPFHIPKTIGIHDTRYPCPCGENAYQQRKRCKAGEQPSTNPLHR